MDASTAVRSPTARPATPGIGSKLVRENPRWRINESRASSRSSGSPCRQPPCGPGCGKPASDPSVRGTEYLDWLLILNQTHLERVLAESMEHDNGHRPHRGLKLKAPDGPCPGLLRIDGESSVQRRDRLGGVIHEYAKAAA
jgi:hypothetical protein